VESAIRGVVLPPDRALSAERARRRRAARALAVLTACAAGACAVVAGAAMAGEAGALAVLCGVGGAAAMAGGRGGAGGSARGGVSDPRLAAEGGFVADAAAAYGLPAAPALRVAPTAAFQATAAPGGVGLVEVSDGLLAAAPRPALRAVLAHELAHLSFGDQLWAARARGAAALTYGVAALGVPLILFGAAVAGGERLISGFATLAGCVFCAAAASGGLARWREFAADRSAAALVGADGLAAALALLGDQERCARRRSGALRWAVAGDVFRPTPRRRLAALRARR